MYSVVWGRLDAVYGRTEVMDQTYLCDLLQIFPLKRCCEPKVLRQPSPWCSGDSFLIKIRTRTAQPYHPDCMEAKSTTYLKEKWNENRKKAGVDLNIIDLDDCVTLKSMNGSKVTASTPPTTAPQRRRPKTEMNIANKTYR
ncbi:hypothetical protein OUZ56_024218 [Daphnia magna]|uniref:Uncharacterized protein n=1 Tax=Daphnia magna TaxID=35525 RepID=A0ABR0B0C5_9CRUS|nr:hypothetical protein OUZ56_024218 [Daphnia magna]